MRYSQTLLPTLKEVPADAEVISHQLMLRAGFIRKLSSGIYTFLPLGLAVIRKVEQIVREEMNRAGAREVLLPMVQPAELWQETGRYHKYGPELLRFTDRNDREFCLGPTHEEVITDLVRREIHSWRDLPINLYQIQTKFRDEIRPRFGLMRGREFIMKDAYSFDVDDQAASLSYEKMAAAYRRIFRRCGLDFRAVQADSGAIGGSFSDEFMVLAATGEDTIVVCDSCEYAANVEKAEVVAPEAAAAAELLPAAKVETPGRRRVPAVCEFLGITPQQLVKTMVYRAETAAGSEFVAVCLRGDHDVEEVKLKNLLAADEVALADDSTVFDVTGVPTGYLGPVGIKIRLVVDQQVTVMTNFYTGANEKNFHLKNVNCGRDFTPQAVADLRRITGDDPCPVCAGSLRLTEGIEVGHIFKLGTGYSESMGAVYQDREGRKRPVVMGCYGIGVSRVVAAAIEQNHDRDGIIFPPSIAPAQVVVVNLGTDDPEITGGAETLYDRLQQAGVDVLLDDRDERPGIKFKDADLLGIPWRVTVGRGFRKDGVFEVRDRRSGEVELLSLQQAVAGLKMRVEKALQFT